MVAYSFKTRFAPPILAGTKRQTIRADRKRHARPGEELQLYTGMRTRHCKLIGKAIVEKVIPVTLQMVERIPGRAGVEGVTWYHPTGPVFCSPLWAKEMNKFARDDGFKNWAEMKAFWAEAHPGLDVFEGVLIQWGALLTVTGEPEVAV